MLVPEPVADPPPARIVGFKAQARQPKETPDDGPQRRRRTQPADAGHPRRRCAPRPSNRARPAPPRRRPPGRCSSAHSRIAPRPSTSLRSCASDATRPSCSSTARRAQVLYRVRVGPEQDRARARRRSPRGSPRTASSRSSRATPDRLECRTFRGGPGRRWTAPTTSSPSSCCCRVSSGISADSSASPLRSLSWLVGLWVAWHFAYLVNPWLGGALAEPGVREWTGRAIVLLIVLLAGVADRQHRRAFRAPRSGPRRDGPAARRGVRSGARRGHRRPPRARRPRRRARRRALVGEDADRCPRPRRSRTGSSAMREPAAIELLREGADEAGA